MFISGRNALCALLASAGVCLSAGWDESVWPASNNFQNVFYYQVWQVYSAAVERANAATNYGATDTDYYPLPPTNYSSYGRAHREYRQGLGYYAQWYAAPWAMPTNQNGNFTNRLTSTLPLTIIDGRDSYPPEQLPEDWPYFAPYTMPSGRGFALTNLPYGYRYDGIGPGTNYPPGQTNWFTGNYAIDATRTLLDNMIYLVAPVTASVVYSTNGSALEGSARTNWLQTCAIADTNIAGNATTSGNIRMYHRGYYSEGSFWASFNNWPRSWSVTNIYTSGVARLYLRFPALTVANGYNEWDTFGLVPTAEPSRTGSNVWIKVAEQVLAGGTNNWSYAIQYGSVTLPYALEPNETTNSTARGFTTANPFVLVEMTGFQFK